MSNQSEVMPDYQGIAHLDLSGNRVTWEEEFNGTDGRILLAGSHFRGSVEMATIVISGLCGLAFLAMVFSLCFVSRERKKTTQYLRWDTVWIPMLCMVGFFVLDLVNRVYHEMEQVIHVAWIAIDIPMGSLASIADATLMIYFTKNSPVQVKRDSQFIPRLIMYGAIWIYALSSIAAKGVQILQLVLQIFGQDSEVIADATPGNVAEALAGDHHPLSRYLKALAAFMKLSTAAAGILIGFAIGLAILAFLYVRRLSETHISHKRLVWTVSILATCYLIRNAVSFIFWLLYSQFHRNAGLGLQLVYMAFYGLLSVVVYLCIILIAIAQGKEDGMMADSGYGVVEQAPIDDGGWNWDKQQSFVRQAPVPRLGADGSTRQDDY